MSKVYDLVFQIAAQLNGQFGSTMSSVAKQVTELSAKTAAFQKQLGQSTALQEAKNKLEELRKAYLRQNAALNESDAELRRLNAPLSVINQNYAKHKNEVDKTAAAMNKQKKEVLALTESLKLNSYATGDIVKQQEALQKAVTKTEASLKAQQKLLEVNGKFSTAKKDLRDAQVGMATSIVTARAAVSTIESVVSAPLKAAMAMEDTMADIKKVVDFKAPDGLAKMQRDLEEMSLRIPLSVKGLGEITAAAGQAGIAEEDLLNFTEAAAKMGVAFEVPAAEAGEMMAKWRSGMGLTQAQAVELADVTNALSNANASEAKQIGEALKRYGALGKVAGLTEKQTAALAATVIGAGAGAEVAATGLNSMMRALTKGGSMTEKQAAAFKNIGFDPQQLQKDIQTNAPKAIMDVLESIKVKVPKEMQNQYLSAMFGEEGARALGPLLANTQALQKNFDLIAQKSNYAGSMQAEFEARAATLSNTFQLLANNMEVIKMSIGVVLIEPFKEASAVALKYGKIVAEWIKNNRSLFKAIWMTAAVLGGLTTAIIVARVVFTALGTAWYAMKASGLLAYKIFLLIKNSTILATIATKAYTAVMTIFPAIMSKAAAMAKVLGVALKALAFNPLTIGIMAAVAAGVLIYKNWDTIKQKAEELWKAFQEKFPGLATAVQSAYDAIKPIVENIKGIFSGIIEFVSGVFSGNWQKAWDGIVKVFSSQFSLIGQLVKAPLNAVIAMVNNCIKGINSMASFKVPDWVPGMGGKGFEINIPEIPALATGGVVKTPTLAMVGEGKEPEAILPISALMKLLGAMGAGDEIKQIPPVVVNVTQAQTQAVNDSEGRSFELAASFERFLSRLNVLTPVNPASVSLENEQPVINVANEKADTGIVPMLKGMATLLGTGGIGQTIQSSEQPTMLATLSDLLANRNANSTINQGAPVTVNMNINVDATGDTTGIKQAVTQAANSATKSLRQELERLRINELRLSYR